MEVDMSVGALELALFVGIVILAIAAHVIFFLVGREKRYKGRYQGALVYGVPVCFGAAGILTPPDVLSMLLVAVPCSLVYGAAVVIWLLRRKQAGLS
jgi:hypothetical protein